MHHLQDINRSPGTNSEVVFRANARRFPPQPVGVRTAKNAPHPKELALAEKWYT